jgi:hypothetical protein
MLPARQEVEMQKQGHSPRQAAGYTRQLVWVLTYAARTELPRDHSR